VSKIGKEKEGRIKEEILRFLYDEYPSFHYTSGIAYEMLRDNEFVLRLMKEMLKDGIVSSFDDKGGRGARKKWKLREEVFSKYKELL